MLYGQTNHNPPSRFLEAIPAAVVKTVDRSTRYGTTFAFGGGDHTNYGGDGEGGYRHAVDFERRAPRPRPVGKTFLEQQNAGAAKPASSAPVAAFAVGDRVRHAGFGEGTIVATAPMGSDTLLSIEFAVGVKKLMANYAKLEKL